MHKDMWVYAVLCSWAGELSGPWGGVASTGKAGYMGMLEIKGVPSAAISLLLTAGTCNSSPLS